MAGVLIGLVLGVAALVMAVILMQQTSQRRQLQHWLDTDCRGEVPDGKGEWRAVFSQLQRLRKNEQRAQAALQERIERFDLAVQALPDGVVLLGPGGHIEWLNRAAADHLMLDPERDIGTLIGQLIRQGAFLDYLEGFRRGRQAKALQISIGHGAGPQRLLSIELIAFADTSTLLLSRDITEIARAETVRRDFIANVSHELRTPLTVTTGFLEQMLADDSLASHPARGFMALMAEQSARMNRLVDDLLRLSRLENAAEPPRADEIDMVGLMQSLLAEARALSQGRHRIEVSYACECRLRGSLDELRSAFGNLISNAVRYTPAGGSITLSFEGQGPQLAFAVTDTGIGIPAEHIPRLTERFYRVDKGRSAETGGTGLGLAIVKHVLARHQGLLSIRSKPGMGSTFTAFLPAERRMREKPVD